MEENGLFSHHTKRLDEQNDTKQHGDTQWGLIRSESAAAATTIKAFSCSSQRGKPLLEILATSSSQIPFRLRLSENTDGDKTDADTQHELSVCQLSLNLGTHGGRSRCSGTTNLTNMTVEHSLFINVLPASPAAAFHLKCNFTSRTEHPQSLHLNKRMNSQRAAWVKWIWGHLLLSKSIYEDVCLRSARHQSANCKAGGRRPSWLF